VGKASTLLLAIILAAACSYPAFAADDIPTYRVLTCEKDCPVFKPAAAISLPKPSYPDFYTGMSGAYVEALVDVHYTIATDGKVKDAVVDRLAGPPLFQDSVLNALKSWTYQPATEDGKPVEQNRRKRFVFRIREDGEDARSDVVTIYHRAMSLLGDNKPDEAAAAFQSILDKSDLDFYERCMASLALANIYTVQNKYSEALGLAKDATIDNGALLGKGAQAMALRLRVRLEAATDNIAEAFAWFDILKANTEISDADPDAKLIANLHAALLSGRPIAFDATIPPAMQDAGVTSGVWEHTLLKRRFSFAGAAGHLSGFKLLCETHGIESAVSDTAEWTVPKSWSDCEIYVAGPPGTKFQFVESNPDPVAH